jgi:multiple sugar transport system ATP-binding protein
MNLYRAHVSPDGNQVRLGDQDLDISPALQRDSALANYRDADVILGIRPENLEDAALGGAVAAGRRLTGTVELVEALGSEKLVHFRIDADRIETGDAFVTSGADDISELQSGEIGSATMSASVARVDPKSAIVVGDKAQFAVDIDAMRLFDIETEAAIRTLGI